MLLCCFLNHSIYNSQYDLSKEPFIGLLTAFGQDRPSNIRPANRRVSSTVALGIGVAQDVKSSLTALRSAWTARHQRRWKCTPRGRYRSSDRMVCMNAGDAMPFIEVAENPPAQEGTSTGTLVLLERDGRIFVRSVACDRDSLRIGRRPNRERSRDHRTEGSPT